MIDPAARKQMADAIRSYLNEEIRSFRFSDALDDIRTQTDDPTVSLIADILYCRCDNDIQNHQVIASRREWDYFHRLLLVLDSDTELEVVKTRKWSPRQTIAASAVAIFVILALRVGWGIHLLALSAAFALVSILLDRWRYKEAARLDAKDIALTPFVSIPQILAARRRALRFSKRRYSGHLARRLRYAIIDMLVFLPFTLVAYAVRVILSPILLLSQAMPETDSKVRVTAFLPLGEQKS